MGTSDPPESFRGLLLRHRLRTGLIQRDLAARAGVSRGALQAWEAGLTYPSAERLQTLIRVLLEAGALTEGRAPAGVVHMVIYGIPGNVTGFAEGELSKESDKFVGGKSTMEKNTYWGPGTPPNTDWHHYTFILMATDLDPKDPALKPGMTRDELAAALQGHVKASAGLVTRFKHQ